eukprot:gene5703-5942_t
MDDGEAICWICLGGPQSPTCKLSGQATSEQQGSRLVRVCACPRPVHRECLARWQLQQAGRSEERYCRFCNKEYPDWKDALTPIELRPTTPIMAVSVRGRVHKLRVKPGPEGKEDFKRQVRQLLGYDDSMEFDVIFECKTPHSGEKVQLHGFSAFDAATHCAAVSAAKRLRNKQSRQVAFQAATNSSRTRVNGSDMAGPSEAYSPVDYMRQSLQADAPVPYRRSLSSLQRHTELYMAQQHLSSAAAAASASLLNKAAPSQPQPPSTAGSGKSSRAPSSSAISSTTLNNGASMDAASAHTDQALASALKQSNADVAKCCSIPDQFAPCSIPGTPGIAEAGGCGASAASGAWLPAPLSVIAAVANLPASSGSLSPAASDPDAFAAATLHASGAAAGSTLSASSSSSAPLNCCDSLVAPSAAGHLPFANMGDSCLKPGVETRRSRLMVVWTVLE